MQTQPQVGISASSNRTSENNNSTANSFNSLTSIKPHSPQMSAFSQPAKAPPEANTGPQQSQSIVSPTQHFTQPPSLQINQLSLAEMESIITPLSRRRSEGFVQQEVRLMIKEIEKRRHILLSTSPAYSKLKKKAWEEVANSMALKRPHEPRRTGEQVGARFNCMRKVFVKQLNNIFWQSHPADCNNEIFSTHHTIDKEEMGEHSIKDEEEGSRRSGHTGVGLE